MAEPEWKTYERQIFDLLRNKVVSDAVVSFDEHGRQALPGYFSKVDRQIDVIVRGRFAGLERVLTLIVDCKCFSRKVHVGDVDQFLGLVEDVRAPMGLMITNVGYSSAAKHRAEGSPGVSLDVVELDQLALWKARVPMFSHSAGAATALLTAIVDGETVTTVVDLDIANRLMDELGYDAPHFD